MLKKNIKIGTLISFALITLSGCKDVFEKDLSDDSVYLITPLDSAVAKVLQQNFRWEENSEALFYELQIVSPSFSKPASFELDTTISKTMFLHTLLPSLQYQWRVKAVNGSSSSLYSTRTLFTDTTNSLTNYEVQLISPSQNLATNNVDVVFTWQEVPNAKDYNIELRYNNQQNEVVNNLRLRTDSAQITLTNLPEGDFLWYVQGHNDFSVTPYASRNIVVDITAPLKPTLLLPTHMDSINSFPTTFSWNSDNASGSTVSNKLEIYTDTSSFNLALEYTTTNNSAPIDTLNIGSYFWRVKSEDAAGNIGSYSTIYEFTVK
jgi:hypothetical protein